MLKKTKCFDLKAAIEQHAVTREERIVTDLTFAELAKAWIAAHPNDAKSYDRLQKWLPLYGPRNAWEIETDELRNAMEAMRAGGYADSTINRDISSLGSLYKWALAERMTPKNFRSPTLGIKRYHEVPRVVEIKADERERMLALSKGMGKRFAIFVHLLGDTGARKSELLERTWGEIDLDRREILLKTSKTGKPRILFFSEETANLIRRYAPTSRPADELAFPGRVKTNPIEFRKSWLRLCKLAGVDGLHQHDVRHDVARRLLVGGISLPVAASMMGHGPGVLAARYGHLSISDHRKAAESIFRAAA